MAVMVEDRGLLPSELPVAGGGSDGSAPGGSSALDGRAAAGDPQAAVEAPRFELIGSALDLPAPAEGPRPVALTIDSIGVRDALVRPVGVEPNGDLEVPPAEEVGWYRYGPAPGDAGSAVLAAHIAFDGVDGVFRHLIDVEPGARVEVVFDDGTVAEFEVVGRRQYDKLLLPGDEIFGRAGVPRLALITCGGEFDPVEQSYRDNIVAFAVPVAVLDPS